MDGVRYASCDKALFASLHWDDTSDRRGYGVNLVLFQALLPLSAPLESLEVVNRSCKTRLKAIARVLRTGNGKEGAQRHDMGSLLIATDVDARGCDVDMLAQLYTQTGDLALNRLFCTVLTFQNRPQ